MSAILEERTTTALRARSQRARRAVAEQSLSTQPPNMVTYDYRRTIPAYFASQPKSTADNLVYVSGPNGVGKDTMLHGLAQRCPGMTRRIARTTSRPPRPDEEAGVEYEFKSEEEILEGWQQYVAISRYPGNERLYAISRKNIEDAIAQPGTVAVSTAGLEFGPILKALYPRSTSVYIVPWSLPDIFERLKRRGTTDVELDSRWRTANAEMHEVFSHLHAGTNGHFDTYLMNGDLGRSQDRFAAIIKGIGAEQRAN